MPTVPKITKRAIDALSPNQAKPVYLWDASLPGFGVKCSPTNVKRYVVKYRTNGGGRVAPQRWLTLGTHGQLTPDEARKLAQQKLAAVARGEDPQGAKLSDRAAPTLEDVWQRFKDGQLPVRKPQTRYEYESQWKNLLKPALGRTRASQISRNDADKLHKKLRATPYRANRVLALLSKLMTLAETWDLRPTGSNPCRHVERFKEKPRQRYLSASELVSLGDAMSAMIAKNQLAPTVANAIKLLLLTGARLNEILGAEWSWIDRARRVIAVPDSKTGEKEVFLSRDAIRVLVRQARISSESAFVFPDPRGKGRPAVLRGPWAKICEEAKLPNVRLHDLRHTAASIAVGQGTSLPVVGRLLGHSQPQSTQRYAHVDADPALVAANAVGKAMSSALQTKALKVDEKMHPRPKELSNLAIQVRRADGK